MSEAAVLRCRDDERLLGFTNTVLFYDKICHPLGFYCCEDKADLNAASVGTAPLVVCST